MDFLKVADTSADTFRNVVERALETKTDPASVAGSMAGTSVGLFFMKPSTRTRVSSEVGCRQLGADAVVLNDSEVGLGGRETSEDVARVLDRYLDVLALRVFAHQDLEVIAANAQAPVINLLSDAEHPCQAVADMLTVVENADPKTSSLAYIGDGNNVSHSLMVAATIMGMSVRVATPSGYEPDKTYVAAARAHGQVDITNDPSDAIDGADFVYTDVWTSMGQEAETQLRLKDFSGFCVDEELFAKASPDAKFLHCLPAHRGEEVSHDVMEHDRSRVFDQAENRLHAFKAVLLESVS